MSIRDQMKRHRDRIFGKAANYKAVFGSPLGEAVLADIIRESGMYETSYIPGDTHGTAHNEGVRRLATYIVNLVQMSPEEAKRIAELAAHSERDSDEYELIEGGNAA